MDDNYTSNLGNSSIYKNDIIKANSYEITSFNPDNLLDRHGILLMIGMTGSGKTVLLNDLLSHVYKKYDKILVFSRTAKLQKCYDYIDRSLIHDFFNEEMMTQMWNDHKSKHENGGKMENVLIIMDDLINDPLMKKSKIFDDYATGGRHLKFSIWILSQNFTSLKPLTRNNVSWAIAFDISSYKERRKFVEQYMSDHNNRVGDILFRKITKEKYQCVIVEVHKNGAPVNEKVKKYIADITKCPKAIKDKTKGINTGTLELKINTTKKIFCNIK